MTKKEKKERTRRIIVPLEVPESEYKKLEHFSKLSGLGLATVYKMRDRCPKCLEAWEPLIKEEEKKEITVDLVDVPKGTNLTGKRPKAVKFKDQTFKVISWREVAKVTLKNVVKEVDDFSRAEEIKGRKRIYFSTNKNDVVRPIALPDSSYYVMGNVNANSLRKILSRVLNKFNYGKDEVKLILKE